MNTTTALLVKICKAQHAAMESDQYPYCVLMWMNINVVKIVDKNGHNEEVPHTKVGLLQQVYEDKHVHLKQRHLKKNYVTLCNIYR